MKTGLKFTLLALCCLAALALGIGVGSVPLSLGDMAAVMMHKLFGAALPEGFDDTLTSILWNIRLPRVLSAFGVGGILAISGVVFQGVLGNPLASSYTLGVSSGASLGAAVVMMAGFYPLGIFTLPLSGFVFGLATVFGAIAFAQRVDKGLKNNTVILAGMVFSLFVSAILTLLNALNREYMQQLLLWQMGSFASKNFTHVAILMGALALGLVFLLGFRRELDILGFGDDAGKALGVNVGRVKVVLLFAVSLLTGTAVCFTGTIGFVDLIAPHLVRRMFGPSHRLLLPASALFGGAFMVLADTVARTVIAPLDLPVGAVTALIGAPFFAWVYFSRSRSRRAGAERGV